MIGTFRLPAIDDPSRLVEWRLDERGLEWTGTDGHDRWMPYACIRLATLGCLAGRGWQLRLSGPPGVVTITAGEEASPEGLAGFATLAQQLIQGADDAGCRARFRLNHRRLTPQWLWARRGKLMDSGGELARSLPKTTTQS